MPVSCPGCGRAYDPERFSLGRTVRCTCGHRVGPGWRVRLADPARGSGPHPPRFAADAMLGRLARWLRALGFDVTLQGEGSDEDLVRRASDEERVILTRDRRLPEEWRVRPVVVLISDDPEEQLQEVARRFGLADRARPFTRCTRCNVPLEPVRPGEVERRVPEAVRRRTGDFRRCPTCRRLYWAGSHTRRMQRRLARVLARSRRGGREGPVERRSGMRRLDSKWNPPGPAEEEDPHAGAPVLHAGADLPEASVAAVLVHGRGGSAKGMLAFAETQLDGGRAAFIAPEASGQAWYPASFMAPLEENDPWLPSALGVLDRIAERLDEHGLPPEKVLVAGFSQGACLALEYVLRRGGRRLGAAGLSGGLIGPEGHQWTEARPQEGTPVFLGCSDIDPHIPVERVHETARVLEEQGARVTERIYPGMGHTVNDDEVSEVRKLLEEG